MRLRSAIALTLALCGGCTSPFGNNAEDNRASESRSGGVAPAATITLAAADGNPCAARWDGQAASNEELTRRAVGLLEEAIERAGGAQNISGYEALPKVQLNAGPTLTFACVGPVIEALQRSGLSEVMLRPASSAHRAVSVYTFLRKLA